MAKVIATDNFDRDDVDDKLIKENLPMDEAKKIADEMNLGSAVYGRWFYKAVEDSYKLKEFTP